jgi:hypothetical protein
MKKQLLIPFHPYSSESLFETINGEANPKYRRHGSIRMIKAILSYTHLPELTMDNYLADTNDIKSGDSSSPTYKCDFFKELPKQIGNKKYDVIVAIDGYITFKTLILDKVLYNLIMERAPIPTSLEEKINKVDDYMRRLFLSTPFISDIMINGISPYVNIMSNTSYAFIGKFPIIFYNLFGGYTNPSIKFQTLCIEVNLRSIFLKYLNQWFDKNYNQIVDEKQKDDLLRSTDLIYKPGTKITVSTNVSTEYNQMEADPNHPLNKQVEYILTNVPLLIIKIEPILTGGKHVHRDKFKSKVYSKSRSKSRTKSRSKSRTRSPGQRAKSRGKSKKK